MSGVHKHPTISFCVSDREREMIEAKILASGMQKKDYFVRSCIYNRICVVGKKEVIYQLVEELQNMQTNLSELVKQLEQKEVTLTAEGLEDMRNDCMDMLQWREGNFAGIRIHSRRRIDGGCQCRHALWRYQSGQ